MVEEQGERAQWLRRRAERLRRIADQFPTEVSPHLRQLADEIDEWADQVEGRGR